MLEWLTRLEPYLKHSSYSLLQSTVSDHVVRMREADDGGDCRRREDGKNSDLLRPAESDSVN